MRSTEGCRRRNPCSGRPGKGILALRQAVLRNQNRLRTDARGRQTGIDSDQSYLGPGSLRTGRQSYGINGRMAEAILCALMNNQQAALEKIGQFDQTQPVIAVWARSLKA